MDLNTKSVWLLIIANEIRFDPPPQIDEQAREGYLNRRKYKLELSDPELLNKIATVLKNPNNYG